MKYWLLTWNPQRYSWEKMRGGLYDLINRMNQVGKVYDTWSTGVNTSIREGDRIFLIRLGVEPKGIVASGYAVTNVFTAPHWDVARAKAGDVSRHVYVEFDKMIDIEDSPLKMQTLKQISSAFHWSSQVSGISIPENIALEMEKIWKG